MAPTKQVEGGKLARFAIAGEDRDASRADRRRNDLLLPMVKGYCSSRVYELLAVSLQCLGGNGYVEESILPRIYREAPLSSICLRHSPSLVHNGCRRSLLWVLSCRFWSSV